MMVPKQERGKGKWPCCGVGSNSIVCTSFLKLVCKQCCVKGSLYMASPSYVGIWTSHPND